MKVLWHDPVRTKFKLSTVEKTVLCAPLRLRGRERDEGEAATLQYPRVLFTAAARAARALGRPAAGLRPRPAREKEFPSNLFLS